MLGESHHKSIGCYAMAAPEYLCFERFIEYRYP